MLENEVLIVHLAFFSSYACVAFENSRKPYLALFTPSFNGCSVFSKTLLFLKFVITSAMFNF